MSAELSMLTFVPLGYSAMADPADRAAFQTLATVKEEPSDLESEAGDIKVSDGIPIPNTGILFGQFAGLEPFGGTKNVMLKIDLTQIPVL